MTDKDEYNPKMMLETQRRWLNSEYKIAVKQKNKTKIKELQLRKEQLIKDIKRIE